MSLFERFLHLDHSLHFRDFDIAGLAAEVSGLLDRENLQSEYVYVSDDDPCRFALTYLKLLDLKACPVVISKGQNPGNHISHLVDLQWKQKHLGAKNAPSDSYICLSSGSTGEPKRLLLSVAGALANAEAHAKGFHLTAKNRIVQNLPAYHSYGIVAYIFTPLVMNIGVDFCPGIVGLRSFKNAPAAERVLHISPSQARFILKDRFTEPEGLSTITVGAGALHLQELSAFQKKFPKIKLYVSYGLTEAGPRVTAGQFQPDKEQWLSQYSGDWIGSVLPGVQIQVFDGSQFQTEGEGLLCVQSPSLFKNPTADDLVNGWLKTRDHVEIRQGEVFFISRADDIIKCSGITVYPAEMENVIRAFPAVHDVLVLKKNDPVYDEVPVLFAEGNIDLVALEEFLSEKFPQAIIPREIHILEKFPRQSLNKVDRSALKAMIGKV